MIEEFSFGNTGSFKDIQTLNMTAAKIKSANPQLDTDNVIKVNDKLSLLKSKAIYGANASGKSNVIKALQMFIYIVGQSAKDIEMLKIIDHFLLSTKTTKEPSFFQIILRIDGVRYRYGFEADTESIKSEWLFFTPKNREQILFKREGGRIIEMNDTHFQEGRKYIKIVGEVNKDQIVPESSLFLSTLYPAGFSKISKTVFENITHLILLNNNETKFFYNNSSALISDIERKKFIVDFLKIADIGIEDLEVLKNDLEVKIINGDEELTQKAGSKEYLVAYKTQYDESNKAIGKAMLSFEGHESLGTQRMFEISPFIRYSIDQEITFIIDELDARLHPVLTKKIVELYNSPANKGAQLIFTTHDTNLLSPDLLRRDQIDFVEKDKYGASHLYSLAEIKGVRNNDPFEKDYIQGKYGAIPFVGDFSTLIDNE